MSALLADEMSDAPLSALMREGSRTQHTAAESSSFMEELLAGRVNEQGYADYLLRLRKVYVALETVGRDLAATDAVAEAVHDVALERLAAIDADLAVWAPGVDGVSWSRRLPMRTSLGSRPPVPGAVSTPPTTTPATSATSPVARRSAGCSTGSSSSTATGWRSTSSPRSPSRSPTRTATAPAWTRCDLDPAEKIRIVEEVQVAFGLNQGPLRGARRSPRHLSQVS